MKNGPQPPPRGAWFRRTEDGFIVGCSRARWVICFLFLPLTVGLGGFFAWVAVLSLFQAGNPGDRATALGLLLGSVLWCYVWSAISYQRITITVQKNRGKVFTGLWPLGFCQRFDWSKVASISIRRTSCPSDSGDISGLCVAIKESQSGRFILFAFRANLDKQKFVVRQLQKMRQEDITSRSHSQPKFSTPIGLSPGSALLIRKERPQARDDAD
jgi:hypothetical protein